MPLPDPKFAPLARPPSAWEAALVLGGGLVLIGTLVVMSWQPVVKRSVFAVDVAGSTLTDAGTGPYIGSQVCGECHADEAAAHGRSGHARTLGRAADSVVARRLNGRVVVDPERPEVTWTYALTDGRFSVERAEPNLRGSERLVLEYIFGSGDHAATFVTITDPAKPSAREHRLTYLTGLDLLGITPGQRADHAADGTTASSRELSQRETLKCFGCHTTPAALAQATAPGQAPLADADHVVANVMCERCHGPARNHVEAARQGRAELMMPFGPGRWSAESQLGLCGQCHRHPSRFPAERIQPDDPQLTRFQPIGLMQSRCFTSSGGALSCLTCHDPHDQASQDPTVYEAACLSCHSGSSTQASPSQPTCPISPAKGCLGCHMPKLDSGQQVEYTDHWIRVRQPNGQRSAPLR